MVCLLISCCVVEKLLKGCWCWMLTAEKLVIGLGSPFLADDSVGLHVVRQLQTKGLPGVRFVESHAGGLLLLEEMEGAKQVIIVDAMQDEQHQPGEVLILGINGSSQNASCSHDCSLHQALSIGRTLGMELPADDAIHLVVVVAKDLTSFSQQLTPDVEAAVEPACKAVQRLFGF